MSCIFLAQLLDPVGLTSSRSRSTPGAHADIRAKATAQSHTRIFRCRSVGVAIQVSCALAQGRVSVLHLHLWRRGQWLIGFCRPQSNATTRSTTNSMTLPVLVLQAAKSSIVPSSCTNAEFVLPFNILAYPSVTGLSRPSSAHRSMNRVRMQQVNICDSALRKISVPGVRPTLHFQQPGTRSSIFPATRRRKLTWPEHGPF
jgi:hypothetical protein